MNRPPLRRAIARPATGDDSLHVLTEAIEHLARLRTLTGSATPPSGCMP
jgi:hypothetical protein